MNEPILVMTTSDNREVLDALAKLLIERRLAACCQIGQPATSIYRWRDELEVANELVLSIKTMSARLEPLIAAIRENHSYEEPEIISIPIVGGSQSYLDWVAKEVSGDS